MLTDMLARGCLAAVLAGLALSIAPAGSADEGCERHHDGRDGGDRSEACRAAVGAAMARAGAPAAIPAAPGPSSAAPTPSARQTTAPRAAAPAIVTPRQPEAAPAATVRVGAGLTVLALLAGALLAHRRPAAGAGAR